MNPEGVYWAQFINRGTLLRKGNAMVATEPKNTTSYERISYDDLVTYVVYRLTAGKGPAAQTTFEDIVAEAFKLFPKRFSLRGYPQWPDSAVVNKSWLRSRTDKKYIVGSVKDGFKLTQRGLEVAERVESQLGQTPTEGSGDVRSELRTRSGRLLRSIERSPQFQEFKITGRTENMTEYDLADVLLAMPDAPSNRLSANLEQFKDAARLYERHDIEDFLSALEGRFLKRLGVN